MGRTWNSRSRRSGNVLAALAATGVLLVAGGARAGARRINPQQFIQQAVLAPPDPLINDQFGWSVAMNATGNVAVVAAPAEGTLHTGRVIVSTGLGAQWTTRAELVPDLPPGGNYFGHAVAVGGNGRVILASAYAVDQGAGAVFVFRRTGTTWTQEAELQPSDAAPLDHFGQSVALSADGNTALIGAQVKNSGAGAAYVFQRTPVGWVQEQELVASDGLPGDVFGYAVTMSADARTFLIGASYRNGGTGAAYVFTRQQSGWSQSAILTGSDSKLDDRFGAAVALSANGETALIGAPNSGYYPGTPHSAYVFTWDGSAWSQRAELQDDSVNFGISVALNARGSLALVGSTGYDLGSGAGFVFSRNGSQWSQPTALTVARQGRTDLGYSVALDAFGDRALLGAPFEPGTTGEAYLFGTSPALLWPPLSTTP